jgi:hypothetical protein
MDKILEKLFTKYFIFKIQEDWKEELKKIPEELLKKWMDDELFVKIEAECQSLAADTISDVDRKWDNQIWMDINDFVNEYQTDQELAEEEKEKEKEEDYWDSDDDEPGVYTYDDDKEVKLMYCTDADVKCDCDHADPHPYSAGCICGCVYTSHCRCEPYTEQTTELNDDVPDEIVETGGI